MSTPIPILNPYETPNGRHFNLLREAVEALRLLGGGQTTRGQYLLPSASAARPAVIKVFVAWRWWDLGSWTGTKSQYLKIPYDAVTAPSYITESDYNAIDWADAPADDDERNNALIIKLSDFSGPGLVARTT